MLYILCWIARLAANPTSPGAVLVFLDGDGGSRDAEGEVWEGVPLLTGDRA